MSFFFAALIGAGALAAIDCGLARLGVVDCRHQPAQVLLVGAVVGLTVQAGVRVTGVS